MFDTKVTTSKFFYLRQFTHQHMMQSYSIYINEHVDIHDLSPFIYINVFLRAHQAQHSIY